MPSALVDNDLVEKMAKWLCLENVPDALSIPHESVSVLGALKYVVGSRLSKTHCDEVNSQLSEFLAAVGELEPTDSEVSLAAHIEEVSIMAGVDIDVGESQLFAVAAVRDCTRIATGDKRAVCGCASIEPHLPMIKALRGKFASTEQILAKLIELIGCPELRKRVCRERKADKTADICFACGRNAVEKDEVLEALASYQRNLAKNSSNFASDRLLL